MLWCHRIQRQGINNYKLNFKPSVNTLIIELGFLIFPTVRYKCLMVHINSVFMKISCWHMFNWAWICPLSNFTQIFINPDFDSVMLLHGFRNLFCDVYKWKTSGQNIAWILSMVVDIYNLMAPSLEEHWSSYNSYESAIMVTYISLL